MPDARTVFGHIAYQVMDQRRLEHLATLNLPLRGRSVLELGAGIGGLTSFFINRDCQVTSIEPRADSLAVLAERFPSVKPVQLDIESDEAATLPRCEVVFAYGLLYHLENPEAAIDRMAAATKTLLLLETSVSPSPEEELRVGGEEARFPSASVRGVGCLPSRTWIRKRLKRRFAHVYMPTTQPNHPDFPLRWSSVTLRPNHCRAIFVAAHAPIDNPMLTDSLPETQTRGA